MEVRQENDRIHLERIWDPEAKPLTAVLRLFLEAESRKKLGELGHQPPTTEPRLHMKIENSGEIEEDLGVSKLLFAVRFLDPSFHIDDWEWPTYLEYRIGHVTVPITEDWSWPGARKWQKSNAETFIPKLTERGIRVLLYVRDSKKAKPPYLLLRRAAFRGLMLSIPKEVPDDGTFWPKRPICPGDQFLNLAPI